MFGAQESQRPYEWILLQTLTTFYQINAKNDSKLLSAVLSEHGTTGKVTSKVRVKH